MEWLWEQEEMVFVRVVLRMWSWSRKRDRERQWPRRASRDSTPRKMWHNSLPPVIQEKAPDRHGVNKRWNKVINEWLTTDRITAHQSKWDKNFTRLAKNTWEKLLKCNGTLPDNWFQKCKVLVGISVYSGLKNCCNVWRFRTGGGVAPGGVGIMLSAGRVKWSTPSWLSNSV